MKKLLSAIVLMSSMFIFASSAFAAESIKIIVENELIETDQPPVFEKGRVLVPIRAVAESLDASVGWDSKTKTAIVRKWSKSIYLTVGKKTVSVEGSHVSPRYGPSITENVSIDVPVKNINNRVYIPLRVVSEQLGNEVHWANNTVFIHSPKSKWRDYVTGNLSEAREIALSIPGSSDLQSEHEPLDVEFTANRDTYLFPEGEALQFYYIFGDTISFIQFKEGFPLVTWQAHIQTQNGDIPQAFADGNFINQRGTTPEINKPFVYYSSGIFGVSSSVMSGRIDNDGNITETGFLRKADGTVTDDRGTISLTLPDEKRVD